MNQSCIELTKIWEDTDFFELKMVAQSPQCQVNIDFYTTNDELEELRKGIASLGTNEEFVWISGSDTENVTHIIHVAIYFHIDNKMESPFTTRANFYIITERGSLDDFTDQLKKLIMGEKSSIRCIEYFQP